MEVMHVWKLAAFAPTVTSHLRRLFTQVLHGYNVLHVPSSS